METDESDFMLNHVDLDMNWDFDLENKPDYAWEKPSVTTNEEFVLP
jgi:hypothetical protein